MIEFFNKINEWLTVNRVTIIAFITSGNFAATLIAIKSLISNINATKRNTESTNALSKVSKDTEEMNKEIADLKASNNKLLEQLNDLAFRNTKYEDALTKSNTTMNTMLDIMGVAYNNLKDDDSRMIIQNMIAKSKYCSDKASDVVEETAKVLDVAADALDKIVDTKDAVTEVIETVKPNKASRY